jgi:hypothetical protein
MNSSHLYNNQTTLDLEKTGAGGAIPQAIGLTILYHPDLSRVGQVAPLIDRGSNGYAELSRVAPLFRTVDGQPLDVLATPVLSRKPIEIQRAA